jgi:parallel beta-helix repeat protein
LPTLSRRTRFLLLLVGLLVVPTFFLDQLFSPSPVTAPELLGSGPPPTGHWVIVSDTVIEDEQYLLNGSIVIESGANLTLTNVTLWLNCAADGEFNITANSGGELYLHNCTVTAYNTSNTWFFAAKAGSTLLLNATNISYAGYIVNPPYQDPRYSGVWINTDDAKVINCTILENYYGLWLDNANDTLIKDNHVILSSIDGIRLSKANNTILECNLIANSGRYGIMGERSGHNSISENMLTNNSGTGIALYDYSGNTTVRENMVTGSHWRGIQLENSGNSNVSGNTVTNSGWNAILLDRSGQSVVSGNTLTEGVSLWNSGQSVVSGNTLTNSSGIGVDDSSNTVISGNTITNSSEIGIGVDDSSNCTVRGNTVTNSHLDGIGVVDSGNCTVNENTVTNCGLNGILLINSRQNTAHRNIVANSSEYGISLDEFTSNCLLWDNHLATNAEGNAYDANGTNQWDNGTHGNWYDDYTGSDLNQDGIGDSPYSIGGGLVEDRYPLMNLVSPDISPPTLDSPADVTYTVGTTGHTITWRPNDVNPFWYQIFRDGVVIANATWDGTTITLEVDGLASGTYNYTIAVLDRLGYRTTDEVLVTVKPAEEETTGEETTEDDSQRISGFTLPLIGLTFAVGWFLTRSRRRIR